MDARHRMIDAIVGHAEAGEPEDAIADELGLPLEAVLAALNWSAAMLLEELP
jgi:uncharacterized protein (DUF433 family)